MNNFITINKVLMISVVSAISFVVLAGPTSTTMNTFATTNMLTKTRVNPSHRNKMSYVY